MARGKIEGIIVEIGGDASGLRKALTDVNKSISSTQSNLRDVNKLLKLDPSNTELLAQKQRLLGDAIAQTEDKLNVLRQASEKAKASLEAGNLGQDKYDALQREIIKTENSLNDLRAQAQKTDSGLKSSTGGLKDWGNAADKASGKLSGLSKVAGGVIGAAAGLVPATEELNRDLSFLEQNAKNAGIGMGATEKAFKTFNAVSGETDSSVEAVSNLLQAGFTESNLQIAVEGVSGAMSRFPDTLKIESLADSIQETVATGKSIGQFSEYLDRVGIGAENFDAALAGCETQAEKTDLVLKALAEGGGNEAYESWEKNNKALKDYEDAMMGMQMALAELATAIAPVITMVVNGATRVVEWFNALPTSVQAAIGGIVAAVALLAPALAIFSKLASLISGIPKALTLVKTGFTALSGALAGISTPVLIVIGAITALIAIFTTLWNTNENFRQQVSVIWEQIKNAISTVIDTLKEVFQAFVDFVSAIWDKWGDDIMAVVSVVVDTITNLIENGLNIIKNIFKLFTSILKGDWQGAWDAVKNILSSVLNIIKNLVSTAFNALGGIIRSVKSTITNAVKTAFNAAINWITSLPGKALQWGKDFINGFANGIKRKVNAVIDSVKGLARKITSFLHFSRPDEGPLRDYETWMPDFMEGLAKGIEAYTPVVTNAIRQLTADMSANMGTLSAQTAPAMNIQSDTTVYIGNEKFDGYIVKTANRGIGNLQRNAARAKGAY